MLACETVFAPYAAFIPEFSAFCQVLSTPRTCCLRVNTLRTTPEIVRARLAAQGYEAMPSPVAAELLLLPTLQYPGRLLEALGGYVYPQALTSAVVALALAPQPETLVCDLCAAPGSKASYLAQLMHNRGLIVANEPVHERLSMLEYNLRHLGVSNVLTTRYTGQNFPLRYKFQRVLVDAPCSGEGNYRWDTQGRQRHVRRRINSPVDLPRLQKQLLLRGFDLLEPGGQLLYATCTYNPEENEAVVQALLEQRPAQLQPITLPIPHNPGLQHWKEQRYDACMQHCWRLYPHHTGSVGFFVASMRA